ncbi:hypothetical protein ACJJTC_017636 [Scirpophaga incertulas]
MSPDKAAQAQANFHKQYQRTRKPCALSFCMDNLNIEEWSPDQVADWLSGLGGPVARYVPGLRARGLDGPRLLILRCDDLEYLGLNVIGHQELILEAVEQLRNFQYEWGRDCVQHVAARAGAAARALAGVAAAEDEGEDRLSTALMAAAAAFCRAAVPLAGWMGADASDASRAKGPAARLLQLALEAAACAQRDRFADHPRRTLHAVAQAAAAAAEYIVQEVSEPWIVQGASLEAVSLRQAGRGLGFDVVPSLCGYQHLAPPAFGSPAHASGNVLAGDELVQVIRS